MWCDCKALKTDVYLLTDLCKHSLTLHYLTFAGDNIQIGVETAKRLGMGTNFMEGKELMRSDVSKEQLGARAAEFNGFAGVYPEHKFALVQAMQAKGMLIGMTGGSQPPPSKSDSHTCLVCSRRDSESLC